MTQQWQLQDAKNRFSEVVDNAMQQGPQVVTKRGKEAVVVISIEAYRKMQQPQNTLVEFFQSSPLKGIDLDLSRDKSLARDIDLRPHSVTSSTYHRRILSRKALNSAP